MSSTSQLSTPTEQPSTRRPSTTNATALKQTATVAALLSSSVLSAPLSALTATLSAEPPPSGARVVSSGVTTTPFTTLTATTVSSVSLGSVALTPRLALTQSTQSKNQSSHTKALSCRSPVPAKERSTPNTNSARNRASGKS